MWCGVLFHTEAPCGTRKIREKGSHKDISMCSSVKSMEVTTDRCVTRERTWGRKKYLQWTLGICYLQVPACHLLELGMIARRHVPNGSDHEVQMRLLTGRAGGWQRAEYYSTCQSRCSLKHCGKSWHVSKITVHRWTLEDLKGWHDGDLSESYFNSLGWFNVGW